MSISRSPDVTPDSPSRQDGGPPPGPEGMVWAGLPLIWLGGTVFWWGLAFPPVAGEPPGWVAAIQAVCFGAKPGELPAMYGWGALIAPPLAMLGVMMAGWGREVAAGLRALTRRAPGRALVGMLALVLVAQSGWVAWRITERVLRAAAVSPIEAAFGPDAARYQPRTKEPLPEHYPRLNRPAPPFRLVDQQGRRVNEAVFRGRVTFLTFAYGQCATVCPVVVTNIVRAVKDSGMRKPRVVVISLDGWRDTPSSLPGIMERWNMPAGSRLLTGTPVELIEVLKRYEVAWSRNERTGEIDHVALVYVLDEAGRIAYELNNPPVPWLVEAARRAGS